MSIDAMQPQTLKRRKITESRRNDHLKKFSISDPVEQKLTYDKSLSNTTMRNSNPANKIISINSITLVVPIIDDVLCWLREKR
jgi:hypothetical protein